jgi:LysM repeat protein
MGLSDLLSVSGGHEKLIISAFDDEAYTAIRESYIIMYNPTTYSLSVSNQWLTERATSPNAKRAVFRANNSDKVSFEFLFDATGASPPAEDKPGSATSANKDMVDRGSAASALELINGTSDQPGQRHVEDAIKKFFDVTAKRQGDTHKPSYLQLNWGAFEFRGFLETASTNYKLFNSAGLPIRASINASFAESISKKEQSTDANQGSPDITHVRIVKEGDTLPLISERVYGDSSFYLEIARINQITNFRKLKKGQKIILPRLNNKANGSN